MYGGGEDVYFATAGQLGWSQAQEVEDMGGLWMQLVEPDISSIVETKEPNDV